MSCIFCKIILSDIPSYKVYEDKNTLAFLDINPVNAGHILVVPKKHSANIEEVDEETLCRIIKTVKKVGKAIKNGLGVKGYNVMLNNGSVAGQVVSHIHFHLVPRLVDDGLKLWPQRKYVAGEAETVLNKIKLVL